MQRSSNRGFTLIELSIVLVIIGLFAGGILVGRDLIHAAEIRATISQIEQYNTATQAFRLKYNCLPGDCAGATVLGLNVPIVSIDGNGDGRLGTTENLNYWRHLANANLIKEPLNSIADTPLIKLYTSRQGGSAPGFFYVITGDYIVANSGYSMTSGHQFWLTSSIVGGIPGSASIYPPDAFAIDVKTDDGWPFTGKVVATDDMIPGMTWGPKLSLSLGVRGSDSCVYNDFTPNSYGYVIGAARCGLLINTTF